MLLSIIFLIILLTYTVFAVYVERKFAAFVQDRVGPNVTGPKGLLQTIADLLKLLQKEDIINSKTDKTTFLIAPILLFTSIYAGFAIIPFNSSLNASDFPTGILYLAAIISLDIICIVIAGWSSNNKFTVLGTLRTFAQMISYEIPLILSICTVLVFTNTLNLQEITILQSSDSMFSFLEWNIFQFPLLGFSFIIFFICILAESNRTPFDLPESESELIGGFHTEYSGFRWAIIMLSEYGMMFITSTIAVYLFFGGWNSPFNLNLFNSDNPILTTINQSFWLLCKVFILILIQMWVRWTFPRLRVDQLMTLCWKYLIPFSLLLLLVSGLLRIY